MKNKKANIVAVGGMIAALSLLFMLLTRVIPFAEMALPAVAGVLLIPAVLELGTGWAFIIYIAVGMLSLLFAFQNGAAFYYIFFFGHYTIVKNFIERIDKKPLQWVLKLLAFNVCAAALFYIIAAVSGVPGFVAKYGLPIALALANVVFVVYDIALSRLVMMYVTRIRKLFKKS